MMKKNPLYILIAFALLAGACKKFLDVVPDNVSVIDHAFKLRVVAEKYLATCYSRLPSSTNLGNNPGFLAADEFWLNSTSNYSSASYPSWYIALGQQNSNIPLLDYWKSPTGDGVNKNSYWQGITDCNIFIERIPTVPDMSAYEKRQWAAEAKFLKAYYHYLLVRAYGPVIIRDQNIPVYADVSESRASRDGVDECFAYIVKTIDEAIPDLMPIEGDPALQIGRVTQVAAKAMKAEILVQAASPLFNGNADMAALQDDDGKSLFNQTYDQNKWVLAAQACKEAIDFAHANGKSLQRWVPPGGFKVKGPTIKYQMNLRQAISESDGNTEALWYDSKNIAGTAFQGAFTPRGFDPDTKNMYANNLSSNMGATLNMAEKFYSKNGVPITEDKTYPYSTRYDLVTVPNTSEYKYDLQQGYTTVKFHLDREPRFYVTLSFDGGRVLMLSEGDDAKAFNTDYKLTGNINYGTFDYIKTGYAVKKYINYQNSYGASNTLSIRPYIIPFLRLGDLYLLYAEALNESTAAPTADVYAFVDSVRARSGLDGVIKSWTNFSTQASKVTTKEGMRSIIKHERTVELAFEGKRFWDLRRWKDAGLVLNELILGWDNTQPDPAAFYRPVTLFNRTFTTRDYFWPISLDELSRNSALKQNIGW